MPLLRDAFSRGPSPETVAAARSRLAGLSAPPQEPAAPIERGGWVPETRGPDAEPRPARRGEPVAPAEPGGPPPHGIVGLLRAAAPAGIRDARWLPSRRGVVAVLLVGLVAAAVAALAAWHARPRPVAVAPRPITVRSAAPTPAPRARVVVSVAGKVRRPGLVTLPAGARVADAIRAAGGLRRGASVGLLNLARRLSDGEEVVVGLSGAAQPFAGAGADGAAAGTGGPAGVPTSLSTATEPQLEALPGVGPVLAQRIIDYRAAHGGFRSVDELRNVSGIGPKKFAALRPVVTP